MVADGEQVRRAAVDAARHVLVMFAMTCVMIAGAARVGTAQTESGDGASSPSVFPHADDGWLSVSGQLNVIAQAHRGFASAYSGENSLRADPEHAVSRLMTLSTRVRPAAHTEIGIDIESAGGRGLSDALGLAGFTNLDVVRNPTLGSTPYLARFFVRQSVAVGPHTSRGTGVLNRELDGRLDIYVGKVSTADYFDRNEVGSDSHLQFANWTVDNNGAYDYAADTRGYTWGAVAAYTRRHLTVQFGEMLMPTVANGLRLDWNVKRARAENIEVDWRRAEQQPTATTVRLLAFVNHANMGDYRLAIASAESGAAPQPVIEDTRQQGRVKSGVGIGVEQSAGREVRLFGRWGWNEPHYESFAYTEVNASASLGGDTTGASWHRPHDRAGLAFVSNGISAEHREYLALGGRGFLLGDGTLRYGREDIAELYYTAHVWRGVYGSADLQRIAHPGYNRDRGPVTVFGGRLHVDF